MRSIKFFLYSVVTFSLIACKSESETTQSVRQVHQDWCMAQVKNILKDPGSANFKDVVANDGTIGTPAICEGYVNAKNSMGGYVGFKKFKRYSDGEIDISD